MTNIIVALPKIEDAKGIKNLLVPGRLSGDRSLYNGCADHQRGGRIK